MLVQQVWSVCHNFVYSKATLPHPGKMKAAAECYKRNEGAARYYLAQGKVCKEGLSGLKATLWALPLTSCACTNQSRMHLTSALKPAFKIKVLLLFTSSTDVCKLDHALFFVLGRISESITGLLENTADFVDAQSFLPISPF